ncbi:MAG TPA: sugar phosphate isomerase/epimerase [Rhodopirellula sp.]|nr:sugar phosphate isomerase/epimerase [Rhodopirellula sp.]
MNDPKKAGQCVTRRNFMGVTTAVAAGALMTQASTGQTSDTKTSKRNPICVFTKPFNSLSFNELSDRIAELGFDGIEAPIRKGGHVDPDQVEQKLPELVEALKKRDLEITIMTSDINDPDAPATERVLRTAAALGIKRYRMKYFKYDLKQSVLSQIDQWRPKLKQLAAMNHDFGLTGVYQNHAGTNYLGAPLWDLRLALQDIAPSDIGVAYDIRHATAEGGMSWPVTFNMIQPSIDTVYVKDFVWKEGKKPSNVPLGTGRIDPNFFKMLADTGFNGPISLHEEYLDHRNPDLVPEHLAAIKADLATLRAMLKTH